MAKGGRGASPGSHGGHRGLTTRVRTAKRRTTSSTRWLERQLNDPYVAAAKRDGYASRAAFKLIELDDKTHFLKKGASVLDLGAAPGGWTQVAQARIGPKGKIVAVDLQPMSVAPPAVAFELDVEEPESLAIMREALGGPADVVLSDMAPKTIGHTRTDRLRIAALADVAFDVAVRMLAPDGAFVVKLFEGGAHHDLMAELKRAFSKVRHVKPPASRSDSSELYIVATGFRLRETDDQRHPQGSGLDTPAGSV